MVSSSAKHRLLQRVARDIRPGMVVNLGIGLPTQVVSFIDSAMPLCLHSENGITGVGGVTDTPNRNLIDAGGAYVSEVPGTAYMDSATSFALVRSGRLDLTLLGAFQVSAQGDLANWKIPGQFTPGPGGAIELAQKARQVAVLTMHTDRRGQPKILEQCTLPLTAKGCVQRIYTDMAILDVRANGLHLCELASHCTLAELQAATAADILVCDPDNLPRF